MNPYINALNTIEDTYQSLDFEYNNLLNEY